MQMISILHVNLHVIIIYLLNFKVSHNLLLAKLAKQAMQNSLFVNTVNTSGFNFESQFSFPYVLALIVAQQWRSIILLLLKLFHDARWWNENVKKRT